MIGPLVPANRGSSSSTANGRNFTREVFMAGIETRGKRDRANFRGNAFDLGFLVGMVIVAIGLILLSVAVGVGIDPDVSMFAAP
jgi:hypothetical protein